MDHVTAAYDPEQWHDLCVALAGASGALLGLAFVAISFNLDAILADKTCPVARSRRWWISPTPWRAA